MAYAIPNVPGVPALLGGFLPVQAYPLITTALSFLPISAAPQWGIFLGGSAVIIAETVLSVDYKQEWVIADYPVEQGAFESYDKVQRPFDVRMRFAAGQTEEARQALISSIKAIAGDFNLYDFVTPTDIIESVNIQHYDYHRTATNGLGLLVVDVWGWQIMVNSSSGLTNTASPASSDPSVSGPAQPGPVSSTQSLIATGGLLS